VRGHAAARRVPRGAGGDRSEPGDAARLRLPPGAGRRRRGGPRRGRWRQGDPPALMPVLLCRVDDRLVHGQVVIGWGRPLGIDRIALVDEAVAASPFEQELYRMAVPPEMGIEFLNPAEAARRLPEWAQGPNRYLVLTGSVETMARLHDLQPGIVA